MFVTSLFKTCFFVVFVLIFCFALGWLGVCLFVCCFGYFLCVCFVVVVAVLN